MRSCFARRCFGDANFSGHVPKELGNLENLQELLLHSNRLTGADGATQASLSVLDVHVFTVRERSIDTHDCYSHACAGSPHYMYLYVSVEALGPSASAVHT